MLRRELAALAIATTLSAGTLMGCAVGAEFSPNKGNTNTPTAKAAYAGGVQYPSNQTARDDLWLASVVSRDKNTVKIYNFGRQPLRDLQVWINGTFVQRLDGLSPGTSAAIRASDIYNSQGQSLASLTSSGGGAHRVEVLTMQDGVLHTVMGPASE